MVCSSVHTMSTDSPTPHWTTCPACHGTGRLLRKPTLRRVRRHRAAVAAYEAGQIADAPPPLVRNPDRCLDCAGSGLVRALHSTRTDYERYPRLAIIGGGIGGSALAVACQHRGIPYTLYERDTSFAARSQGYGLTLQQASKAIEGLGLPTLPGGIHSTRHVVYTATGEHVGEWGLRRWGIAPQAEIDQRRNVHVARQTLRAALVDQLDKSTIRWNHTLTTLTPSPDGPTTLSFAVADNTVTDTADLVVGADGIRSTVRSFVLGETQTPLQYLGCIVILGITPLAALQDSQHEVLDGKTVFQTANGHERTYVMPYDAEHLMWQLSFPLPETDAVALSAQGPAAMQREAIRRLTGWHDPVPQLLAQTDPACITGYPAYDRALLDPEHLAHAGSATLIGDAAHPMSPFKGQGANQALLDALALARRITATCTPYTPWRELGIRQAILTPFEAEMTTRANRKVTESRHAATVLHTPAVLRDWDGPRT